MMCGLSGYSSCHIISEHGGPQKNYSCTRRTSGFFEYGIWTAIWRSLSKKMSIQRIWLLQFIPLGAVGKAITRYKTNKMHWTFLFGVERSGPNKFHILFGSSNESTGRGLKSILAIHRWTCQSFNDPLQHQR